MENNTLAFFAILSAGLWEKEVKLEQYYPIDYSSIYRLAEEQSVIGVVTAGLEYVSDVKVPQDELLTFIGATLQVEQQNKSMNKFIAQLIKRMSEEGIYTLLVKGQGIAQCYRRPLWRTCGDVDFFLSSDNYEKAKNYLLPIATSFDEGEESRMHLAMNINPWVVELHGNLHCSLSRRIDKVLDEVQNDIFCGGNVRSWINDNTQVFLPSAGNDVVYVFTHILQHFFKGGIGIRQVCDWCRLLWTYRGQIDLQTLESRIKRMSLMTEWQAFAAVAVDYLGMQIDAMPLYKPSKKWSQKADRIVSCILETGNFGHNKDKSYFKKHSFVVYKAISLWKNTEDSLKHLMIFPWDATRVWFRRLYDGAREVVRSINHERNKANK